MPHHHSNDWTTCVAFDTAREFWKLLLPHGMTRGALTRKSDGEDADMLGEGGWEKRYTQWWFDFLSEKGARGVSKDVWVMVRPRPFLTSLRWSAHIFPRI